MLEDAGRKLPESVAPTSVSYVNPGAPTTVPVLFVYRIDPGAPPANGVVDRNRGDVLRLRIRL